MPYRACLPRRETDVDAIDVGGAMTQRDQRKNAQRGIAVRAPFQRGVLDTGRLDAHCLSSIKIACTSSSASSVCVTGGRITASPAFNSTTLVLPSGRVYLTLPPLIT